MSCSPVGVARAAVKWEERLLGCGGVDGEIGAARRRVREYRKAVEALGWWRDSWLLWH